MTLHQQQASSQTAANMQNQASAINIVRTLAAKKTKWAQILKSNPYKIFF